MQMSKQLVSNVLPSGTGQGRAARLGGLPRVGGVSSGPASRRNCCCYCLLPSTPEAFPGTDLMTPHKNRPPLHTVTKGQTRAAHNGYVDVIATVRGGHFVSGNLHAKEMGAANSIIMTRLRLPTAGVSGQTSNK